MKLDLSIHRVDVPAMVAQGSPPVLVLPCEGGLKWQVVDKAFNPAAHLDAKSISHQCHGDYVNVALFPYLTPYDPLSAIGFVSQLSFAVGSLFPNASKLTLAIGYPLDIVESPELASVAFRLWIGFAVCSNEK